MKKGSYKLNEQYFQPTAKVRLVEIYESLSVNRNYSRIYLMPTSSEIPTVCLGPLEDIGTIGYRDNLPILPYKGIDEIKTASGNLTLPDLYELPGLQPMFENVKRMFYVLRPSTFALTSCWDRISNISAKRTKIYDNLLSKSENVEFFAHITSPEETIDVNPEIGVYGWAFTNSLNYISSHGELNWI